MSSANDKVTFLNRVFGTCVIGNDGLNVAVCCPNRNCGSYGTSAKKKLVIRIDTDNYHCWVCEIKGRNLNSLLRKHFPQHIHEYREKFLTKSKNFTIDFYTISQVRCILGISGKIFQIKFQNVGKSKI